MPALQAVRRTSGERVEGSDEIRWGIPTASDYTYPGKSWEEYKDRPDHVLEAQLFDPRHQVFQLGGDVLFEPADFFVAALLQIELLQAHRSRR